MSGAQPEIKHATDSPDAEKKRAALSSILWSTFLTVIKIVAGLASNSLGLISEALHSALDLAAASITFLAVRISGRAPDSGHPYGHGKVESLAALAETILLAATCAWIVLEALERLFHQGQPVQASWWVFAVLLISLAVDLNRSAMLRRVARKHRSQALEADALHFSTDVWSTLVVLLGLVCVFIANQLEPGSTLRQILIRADAAAALGVAGIILIVSWRMARKAINSLMDGGLEEQARLLRHELTAHYPQHQFSSVRLRESGNKYFVDLTVKTPASFRVDVAHDLTADLETLVEHILPGSETSVHVEPEQHSADPAEACLRLASLHRLDIHSLSLLTLDQGLHIFAHLELPAEMPLAQANQISRDFEQDLLTMFGAQTVICHLEPKADQTHRPRTSVGPDHNAAIKSALDDCLRQNSKLYEPDQIIIWSGGSGTGLAFNCKIRGPSTVEQSHLEASRLEDQLRKRLPELSQVLIRVLPNLEP